MTSLYLPAPTRSVPSKAPSVTKASSQNALIATTNNNNTSSPLATHIPPTKVPTYEDRCTAAKELSTLTPSERQNQGRKLFVPRSIADFDTGGAFPEIHVAQYPRNMGNPHLKKGVAPPIEDGKKRGSGFRTGQSVNTTRAIVNVSIDAKGNKDYTSLVTQGTNANKKVYAKHSDLVGHVPTPESIALPSSESINDTTNRTAAALQSLIDSNTALSKPTGHALSNAATSQNQESKTQFVSYTPNPNAPGYNPVASKRIIQLVPKQLDPMMPPKHKHVKAPAGPAEDFTPVLHAPPTKLSKEERESWNVPACISNWKNTRGYTIPLDKRLAADGRGLREDTTINSNFATLSESLYLAERQAREEVRLRALVQKKSVEKAREEREEELRDLARRARMDRGGGGGGVQERVSDPVPNQGGGGGGTAALVEYGSSSDEDEEEKEPHEDSQAAQERDRIRQERRKELKRDLRLEKHKRPQQVKDEEVAIKKARLEGDRDVSEKIALGVNVGSGGGDGGVDGRLYNQSAGLDSGFGAEDEYNTYTKPMFGEGVTSSSIYRPSRGEADGEEQYEALKKGGMTGKFQPDQGFSGAEGGKSVAGGHARTAPVQFEKGGQK